MSDYEAGKALGEQAIDLANIAAERLPDESELIYIGSTSVWRTPDGEVRVLTIETEFD